MMLKKILVHLREGTFYKVLKSRLSSHYLREKYIRAYINEHRKIKRSLANEINILILNDAPNKNNEIISLLTRQINLFRLSSNKNPTFLDDLVIYIIAKREDKEVRENSETLLLNSINALSYTIFHVNEWKILHYVTGNNGCYVLANKFREKALESAIKNNADDPYSLFDKFTALCDVGNLEKIPDLLNTIRKKHPKKLPVAQMEHYYNVIRGEREKTLSSAKRKYSKSDKQFANYIKNKTVAVVGPAPSSEKLGKEIDSFDIVIRLNYKGKASLPDHTEFGQKINVGYYNKANAKIITSMNTDFFDDLEFCVFKSIQHGYQKKLYRARKIISPNLFLFTGRANMIPHVVYDLLNFDLNFIKVFKTNFFMSENPYSKNYYRNSELISNQWKLWYSHTQHDVFNQLNFLRNVAENNNIISDKTCMNVLALKNIEYAINMQHLYSR